VRPSGGFLLLIMLDRRAQSTPPNDDHMDGSCLRYIMAGKNHFVRVELQDRTIAFVGHHVAPYRTAKRKPVGGRLVAVRPGGGLLPLVDHACRRGPVEPPNDDHMTGTWPTQPPDIMAGLAGAPVSAGSSSTQHRTARTTTMMNAFEPPSKPRQQQRQRWDTCIFLPKWFDIRTGGFLSVIRRHIAIWREVE
jgi:hypothetical protein